MNHELFFHKTPSRKQNFQEESYNVIFLAASTDVELFSFPVGSMKIINSVFSWRPKEMSAVRHSESSRPNIPHGWPT